MKLNHIYNESNLDTMGRMPDGLVDLTVTSPPYNNLRKYNGYSFPFEAIARELYRVTKPGGVVVWVVGDETINGSETMTSFRQAMHFVDCGFNLWQTIIWNKPGTHPNHKYRYPKMHEYMFVLSKGQPNSYHPLTKKNRFSGEPKKNIKRQRNGEVKTYGSHVVAENGVRTSVWDINVGYNHSAKDEIAYSHPAIFPEQLAADHIKSWSNEGDLVYDPFGGSGTTCKMCHLLDRKWIMSEISSVYCDLARKRLDPYLRQTKLAF